MRELNRHHRLADLIVKIRRLTLTCFIFIDESLTELYKIKKQFKTLKRKMLV